jgi:hypothetical protein
MEGWFLMGQFIDLKNKKFGKLTVIERAPASNEKEAMWKCQCDCGNIVVTRGSSLRCGASKTCGCSRIEWSQTGNAKRTHGSTGERLYRVWVGMRQRCYLKIHNRYQRYGGRGIRVCPEWEDYTIFKTWAMSNGYNPNAKRGVCTIDRIDVNGNYEPSNCRWVDAKIQAQNKEKN